MRKIFVAGVLCALASVACGQGTVEQSSATTPAQARLPQQILGLRVQPENIESKLKSIRRPYVDAVAVFSLRDGDLLRASLQINRFNGAARPKDANFIGTIVSTIGGSASQLYRVADTNVYATSASSQVVFTWFKGHGMFVLAVQKDFQFPRTLLRRLLDSGVTI